MRLDKFLADMQIGSRKEVKSYIKKGLVKVNPVSYTHLTLPTNSRV